MEAMFPGDYIVPSSSSFQAASGANQRFDKVLAPTLQQFCRNTVNIFLTTFPCRRREKELQGRRSSPKLTVKTWILTLIWKAYSATLISPQTNSAYLLNGHG
jgi:hypothetical protein